MQRDLSARRIIGFACNQAFVFFALFISAPNAGDADRSGLLFILLFMVVGFALVRALGPQRFSRLFARPCLYIYAVLAAVGLILPVVFSGTGLAGVAARGVLVGSTTALLLTAWGRSFGGASTEVSVPEVFLGSLVGALVCLAFSLGAESYVSLVAVCLLPIASVVNIEIDEGGPSAAVAASDGEARMLSAKILAGTLLFGMAAGLVLLFNDDMGGLLLSHYQIAFVLYGAFLIGGLTLLLSDGFGRGAALNKSYRLAVFVMMAGVLVAPWPLLAGSALEGGEAVVLAGFLGLEAVLISLFLVLAEISSTDCGMSFSTGFFALFAGELLGALIALGIGADSPVIAILAGVITLIGYVFLFTERDFDELSQLVTEGDSLELAQERIVERYGLSSRESEILAFALRGRTSERIAQELVISKSTVDTHLRRIYAKCGVHSRQELLDLAE